MDDNNKRENHWYLAGGLVQALGQVMRPRASAVVLWLVLIVGCLVAFRTGLLETLARNPSSPAFVPGFTVVIIVCALGAGLLLAKLRQSNVRVGYLKALASPSPAALIEVIERSMRTSRAHPELDALTAQSKAIAFALYGQDKDAEMALAGVNWKAKPPLVQAIGLSAEGVIDLLCRRDVQRALEVTRRARAMSSVSGIVPGAAQSERYHNTCVAVAEVLRKLESASSVKWLEESAADDRFPPLQLLASFGLAIALDRAGNAQRSSELRAFIKKTAPHCAPLHLAPEAFGGDRESVPGAQEGPVSTALPSTHQESQSVQASSAKKKIVKVVGVMVGLWALLIVMFFVMYSIFAQPK